MRLGALFNIIGVVVAIIVAVLGSFYSKKYNFVDISFDDVKSVRVRCSAGEVKKLLSLRS